MAGPCHWPELTRQPTLCLRRRRSSCTKHLSLELRSCSPSLERATSATKQHEVSSFISIRRHILCITPPLSRLRYTDNHSHVDSSDHHLQGGHLRRRCKLGPVAPFRHDTSTNRSIAQQSAEPPYKVTPRPEKGYIYLYQEDGTSTMTGTRVKNPPLGG